MLMLCLQAFDAMRSSASDCCAIMRFQPTASRQFVLVVFHALYKSFVAYGAIGGNLDGGNLDLDSFPNWAEECFIEMSPHRAGVAVFGATVRSLVSVSRSLINGRTNEI